MKSNFHVKILTLAIGIVMCFSMCFSVYATDMDNANDEIFNLAVSAHAYLEGCDPVQFALEDGVTIVSTEFRIFDYSGEEITDEFLSDTKAFYLDEDWESLAIYCDKNIQRISRIVETVQPMGMDIAKTYDRFNAEELRDGHTDCVVSYKVRGVIYYNPNTYYISSASTPIRVSLTVSRPDWYEVTTSHERGNSTIASNHLSAKFDYSFKVHGGSLGYERTELGYEKI